MASRRKREQVHQRLEMNARHKCDVSGCTKHRTGLSYYCARHAKAAKRYGHPEARRIRKKEYEYERKQLVRFMRLHLNHPAMIAAVKWADLWLREAAAGQSVPAASNMARLAAAGIAGADIIEEVLALWLYSHWRPTALPDDLRLTKALGTNVLLLAPKDTADELTPSGHKKWRELGATVRREAGEHVRESLGVFVLNVLNAIGRQMKTKQDHAQALRLPFSSDALDAPTTTPPEDDTNTH